MCKPHHFDVEVPNGPISRGVCRNCGESRDFANSADAGAVDFGALSKTVMPRYGDLGERLRLAMELSSIGPKVYRPNAPSRV